MELVLPPDWERHPELVQALQVLVEGAVRSLSGPAVDQPVQRKQGRPRRSPPAAL